MLPIWVNAQDNPDDEREEDRSSFLAYKFGINFPGKAFNESNYSSPQVASGIGMGLEGLWLVRRHFGFKVAWQYQQMSRASIDPFQVPNYISGQAPKSWNSNLFLGGLGFSKPFGNWDLEAHALAGPGITSEFRRFFDRFDSKYSQRFVYSGNALWYQAGVSARFDQKPGWSVSINYDWNFAPFHPYQSVENYSGTAGGTLVSNGSKALQISLFSFSVLYSIPHYK